MNKDESNYTIIPTKSVGHLTKWKVKHKEDNKGISQKRDTHSARLQEPEGKTNMIKLLNVQQVEEGERTSKREKSSAEQSLCDDEKMAVH